MTTLTDVTMLCRVMWSFATEDLLDVELEHPDHADRARRLKDALILARWNLRRVQESELPLEDLPMLMMEAHRLLSEARDFVWEVD